MNQISSLLIFEGRLNQFGFTMADTRIVNHMTAKTVLLLPAPSVWFKLIAQYRLKAKLYSGQHNSMNV